MNTKPAVVSPLVEGQMVIIVARFVLIVACFILILADAKSGSAAVKFIVTRFEIMVVLLLAVSNFYLVSQVLTKRKTPDIILYGMSLADIAVISVVIIAQGGFSSGTYIFYFPAMLAFALAFPMMELYLFLGGTISLYGFICLTTLQGNVDNLESLLVRLLMLTAVAVCGNHFAQIERNRRNVILGNHFAAQQPQPQVEPSAPVLTQQTPIRY
jgi:hypothetical protein